MCFRLDFRNKSLILLSLLSSSVFAVAPLATSMYYSTYEALLGAGVSSNNAMSDAEHITRSAMFPEHYKKWSKSSPPLGTSSPDVSSASGVSSSDVSSASGVSSNDTILKTLLSDGLVKRLELVDKLDDSKKSFFFNAFEYGTETDRKVIERYYDDKGFDIKFGYTQNYDDISRIADAFSNGGFCPNNGEWCYSDVFASGDFKLAPVYYGLVGDYMYRSNEKVIDKNGEALYVYFNDPFQFYEYAYHFGIVTYKLNKVEFEHYKNQPPILVYEEKIESFDDVQDADFRVEKAFSFGGKEVNRADFLYRKDVYSIDYSGEIGSALERARELVDICESDFANGTYPGRSLEQACSSGNRLFLTDFLFSDEIAGSFTFLTPLGVSSQSELPVNKDDDFYDREHNIVEKVDNAINADRFRSELSKYVMSINSQSEVFNSLVSSSVQDLSNNENISFESRELIKSGSLNYSPQIVSSGASYSGGVAGGGGGVTGNSLVENKKLSFDSFVSSASSRSSSISSRGVRDNTIGDSLPLGAGARDNAIGDSLPLGAGSTTGARDNAIGDSLPLGAGATTGAGDNAIGDSLPLGAGATTGARDNAIGDSLPLGAGATTGARDNAIGDSLPLGAGATTGARDNAIGDSLPLGAGATTGASSTSVTGSRSISTTQSQSTTATAETTSTDKKQEEKKEELDLPLLDDFDVLKPIRDWKNGILSKIQTTNISGQCPELAFDFFGSQVSTTAHCEIFEQISGIISAFSLFIWSLMALRVILSA